MFYALAATGATEAMADLLAMFTSVFTWFITQMTSLVTFILANPLLMLMTAVLMVGAVVGMFTRILKSL